MAVMPRPFVPAPIPAPAEPEAPLRRCTFRRVTAVASRGKAPEYEVDCMFPDRSRAVPLGNIERARSICANCTNPGIFRADSD